MDPSLSQDGRLKARRRLFFAFLAFMVLSLGSFAVVLALIVVPYEKSADTQAHGLPRSGIVTSVANHAGRSRSADVAVRLDQSVDGRTTTTAHVPDLVSLSPGAAVRVLVSPRDPGYAELPRQPYVQKSSAQVAVIAGLALIAVSTSLTAYSASAWRRERRARARGTRN